MFSSRKLEAATDKLRGRQIGWEGYSRAGDLSQDQLKAVLQLAKQPKHVTDHTISQDPASYAGLLVRLIGSISRGDAQQWSLVILADLVGSGDSGLKAVLDQQPWSALCRQMDSSDEFCQLKSATVVSMLLPHASSAPEQVSVKLVKCLGAFLRQSADNQEIALQCLAEVLRSHDMRLAIWKTETSDKGKGHANMKEQGKIIEGLVNMLKTVVSPTTSVAPQTQYQVALCFWLFSYERDICERIESLFGVVPLLSDVARRAVKDKVVRVVLATFRNFLVLAPAANKAALLMSSSGMLPYTQGLITTKRFLGDDEIKEDAEWIRDYLRTASRELSTWDQYVSEVESKRLAWSPIHTDDEFWSANASKLSLSAGTNQGVLNKLVDLLDQQEGLSAQTHAIVCNDLSMFIKYHDLGKRDIQKLGGKTKVLQLLSSQDPDVRYKALVVVQQLVSQSWTS